MLSIRFGDWIMTDEMSKQWSGFMIINPKTRENKVRVFESLKAWEKWRGHDGSAWADIWEPRQKSILETAHMSAPRRNTPLFQTRILFGWLGRRIIKEMEKSNCILRFDVPHHSLTTTVITFAIVFPLLFSYQLPYKTNPNPFFSR